MRSYRCRISDDRYNNIAVEFGPLVAEEGYSAVGFRSRNDGRNSDTGSFAVRGKSIVLNNATPTVAAILCKLYLS